MENAFIEIRNRLAAEPLRAISSAETHEILERYGWSIAAARPLLADVYRVALRHAAEDGELSDAEQRFLNDLATGLALTDEQIAGERRKVLEDLYRQAVAEAAKDEHLSDVERARLDNTAKTFGLSEDQVKQVYGAEVLRVLQVMFDRATADKRLTASEDEVLAAAAKNFGVTIAHDEQTSAAVKRMRELARIEAGDLPILGVQIILQRNEVCHAAAGAILHEIRTVTKRVNYSGLTSSVKIVGPIRWRVGSMAFDRIQKDVMTAVDSGALYVTSKRLIFDGSKKNGVIQLSKIMNFTVFSDGLQVQKERGKDQFFIGEADWERIGAILGTAIGRS